MKKEYKFEAIDLSGNFIEEIGSIQFFTDGTIIVNDEIPVKTLQLSLSSGIVDISIKLKE